jgi:tRNA (adenine37-N6)-methyltransferase
MKPIGFVRTPFPEKFGIPRQPGLVEAARGVLHLYPEYSQPGVFDGLETCSHIWLTFWFHQQPQDWSPKVRPPRLGGNQKLGVFASRSPRRPNPIGLSVVRLLSVDHQANRLELAGLDLLDGTPILDIKPYIRYTDSVPEAFYEMAQEPPSLLPVSFADEAATSLEQDPEHKELIQQVLSQDPRPAYHQDERIYGTSLDGFNVKWQVKDGTVTVLSVLSHPGHEQSGRQDP